MQLTDRCEAAMRRLIIAAIWVGLTLPAAAEDRYEIFAQDAVLASVAELNCPGAHINTKIMSILKRATVRDADNDRVEEAINRIRPGVEASLASQGPTKWCVAVAEAFGYNGLLVPGLIDFGN